VDITKPLEFDKHGIVQVGPMRLGFVSPTSISFRRENPRKMSDAQFNALRASVDKLGFKSFLFVEEIKPGRYGLIDGHHRLKVLLEKGAPRIPIILMEDGAEAAMADLAMLSFNVSGQANGAVYVDFLKQLTDQHGADITALMTGLEPGMLEDMTSTIGDLLEQIAAGESSGAMGDHFGGTAFVGRPIRVELNNDDTTRDLLAKAREKSGTQTDGAAVLAALVAYTAPAE
jgi:hypothetical protein